MKLQKYFKIINLFIYSFIWYSFLTIRTCISVYLSKNVLRKERIVGLAMVLGAFNYTNAILIY